MMNKEMFVLLLFLSHSECKVSEEPHCSKYDFEEKVLEKMVRMEFQMDIMKSEITKSVNTIGALKEEVRESVTAVDEKLKVVADNLEKMAELETKLNLKHKELNNQFGDKFAALENKTVETLNGELETLKEEAVIPTVAFKARLNTDSSVTTGQAIVFPTVLFNAGEAYNPDNGLFTAPVSGTYLFNIAFCVNAKKYLVAGIMVDTVRHTVALSYGDAAHECNTADTVVVLTAGQQVWIEPLPGGTSGVTILNQDVYRWNTFSGTLLHK